MEKQMRKDSKVLWVLKSLLASYIVTVALLLLLTVFLYKLDLSEKAVSAAVVGIYVMSTIVGGLIIGKLAKVRRFVWGLGLGIGYFALILLITLGVYHTLSGNSAGIVSSFLLCAGGGMIGGMIS